MSGEIGRREHAYALLERLTDELGLPAVMVVIDHGHTESHVQINDPGTEDLAELKLLGQKALYALSLYIARIDEMLAAQAAAQSTQH